MSFLQGWGDPVVPDGRFSPGIVVVVVRRPAYLFQCHKLSSRTCWHCHILPPLPQSNGQRVRHIRMIPRRRR